MSDTFDRSRSHLIHSAVDTDQVPEGPKVVKARTWGIPVVGVKWLREWAQAQADERDADARRESQARKGKGREVEPGAHFVTRSRVAASLRPCFAVQLASRPRRSTMTALTTACPDLWTAVWSRSRPRSR